MRHPRHDRARRHPAGRGSPSRSRRAKPRRRGSIAPSGPCKTPNCTEGARTKGRELSGGHGSGPPRNGCRRRGRRVRQMLKRWLSLDPARQAARPAHDGPGVALPPPASCVGRGDGQPEADRCRRRMKPRGDIGSVNAQSLVCCPKFVSINFSVILITWLEICC